jgi:hypothetical protein
LLGRLEKCGRIAVCPNALILLGVKFEVPA